jgi:hypothetical protein
MYLGVNDMRYLSLASAILVLGATAAAAEDCPWAGGSYKGDDLNFKTEFTVNDDCTEINLQSSGSAGFQAADTPATRPLVMTDGTWVGEGGDVKVTLESDGHWVAFDAPGVVNKRIRVTKEN